MAFSKLFLCLTSAAVLSVLACLPVLARAASIEFNPVNKQFLEGCKSTISVMVDPKGGSSNAADVEIKYNPAQITVLDSQSSIPGVQVKPGDAYESYFGNDVNPTSGIIRLAGGSFVSSLSSKKTFAVIEFESKSGVTATNFSVVFDGVGATLDSNIADASTSGDLLKSVTNGSYTFITGPCQADTQPPAVVFQNPQDFTSGFTSDGEFKIRLTDNQSGIDLNSLIITINGDEYTISSSELSYTGSPLDYTITIKLKSPIPDNAKSTAKVDVRDVRGNRRVSDVVFNIPPEVKEQLICPDPDLIDTDGDGIPNVTDGDIDGDGIANDEDDDMDGDDILNNVDGDANGNGVIDTYEKTNTSNNGLNTTEFDEKNNQNIRQFTSVPFFASATGIAPSLGLNAAGVFILACLGAFLVILAWIAFLFGRKVYGINGKATDVTTQDPLTLATVDVFKIGSGKKIATERTSQNAEFWFEVTAGTYQVVAHTAKGYFTKMYQVPNLETLNNPHNSIADAYKGGLFSLLHYLRSRIQMAFSTITPGLIFISIICAMFNVILLPSLVNIVVVVAAAILTVLSLFFRK